MIGFNDIAHTAAVLNLGKMLARGCNGLNFATCPPNRHFGTPSDNFSSNHIHAEEGTDILDYSGEIGNVALRISAFVSTTTNFASKGNKTTNATVDYSKGDNGSLITCNYPKSCEDGIGSESGRDLGDPSIASGKGLVGSRYGDAN